MPKLCISIFVSLILFLDSIPPYIILFFESNLATKLLLDNKAIAF